VGLAVSGGPDSLAMLVLAHLASPGMVEAATVDHGLRPESAGEAAHVAAVCQALGVPHAILSVNVGPGNVQANARSARYAALGAWAQERGLQSIATAHHADDQAETVLMRLNRASGLGGLAGIRAKTAGDGGPPVIRPLLGWRKQELEAVVSAADLFFVRDPSNVDVRFDRARLRAGLAQADWIDPLAIARSAALLAEADAALDHVASGIGDTEFTWEDPALTWRPGDHPRAIRLRLIALAIARVSGATPSPADAALVEDHVGQASGRRLNVAGVLVSRNKAGWRFAPEPVRRSNRPSSSSRPG
jgi:tRNA(Ile)-lysidine synthase